MSGRTDKNLPILPMLLFFSIFIIIGIVLIGLGIRDKKQTDETDAYYGETKGVVIAHNTHYDSDDDATTYSSVVEYQVNGTIYTIGSSISSSEKEPIGKERVVRYNPENPGEAYLGDGIRDYWFLIFVGAFFIMIPSVMLVGMLDKRGNLVSILMSLVFFIVGAALLYYGYLTYGSISPFKIVTLVGYVFMAVPGLMIYSVIQKKKSKSSNRQSGLNKELIYEGEMVPNHEENVTEPIVEFYENNREELEQVKDILEDKVRPAAHDIVNITRILGYIFPIFFLMFFLFGGCNALGIMILGGAGVFDILITGVSFILIPLVIIIVLMYKLIKNIKTFRGDKNE